MPATLTPRAPGRERYVDTLARTGMDPVFAETLAEDVGEMAVASVGEKIDSLTEVVMSRVESMQAAMTAEIKVLTARMDAQDIKFDTFGKTLAEHGRLIRSLEERHVASMQSMEERHAASMQSMVASMQSMEERHVASMQSMEERHAASMKSMEERHAASMKSMAEWFAASMQSLETSMKSLETRQGKAMEALEKRYSGVSKQQFTLLWTIVGAGLVGGLALVAERVRTIFGL